MALVGGRGSQRVEVDAEGVNTGPIRPTYHAAPSDTSGTFR